MVVRGPRSWTALRRLDSPSSGPPQSQDLPGCAIYVDGVRELGPCGHAAGLSRVRALGRGFIWLHLHEPPVDQLHSIADELGLHHLDVEDALHPRQRPKFQRYDDSVVLLLKTLTQVDGDRTARTRERMAIGQITVFVGRDYVLTVAHGEHTGLDEVRQLIETAPTMRASTPDAVLYAITDHAVGRYLHTARLVEADVDSIEHDVFSPSVPTNIEFLYLVSREVVHLRRLIGPLTPALRGIAEDRGDEAISPETRRYLRDVMQHNVEVVERLDAYGESLTTLLESAYGREGTQQNVDLRKISSWAALAAIPTTLSGIYGMRFVDIPEEHWVGGYPTVLAVMALTTAVLYRLFHRRGWL